MDIKLRYVHTDRDRHGNLRVYYWRRGSRKVRLRETPGSEAFLREYHAAAERYETGELSTPAPKLCVPRIAPGTLGWLVERYYREAPAFQDLDPKTQHVRRGILEHVLDEPIYPGAALTFRDFPLARLKPKHVRILRDRKGKDLPEAANGRLKALRQVFRWAASDEDADPIVEDNPAARVQYLQTASDGHYSWTEADIGKFEARHPIGSKARLALALIVYTGLRGSDLVELGRQHRRDGWFHKRQFKGRKRRLVMIEVPVLPALDEVLARSPCGALTYLETEQGQPYTAKGFQNWFRRRCDEAGLPECSAHGIRKAAAAHAAENGATPHQLMSIFGWLTLKEAERYTRAAQRRRMAADAMHLLDRSGAVDSHRKSTHQPGADKTAEKDSDFNVPDKRLVPRGGT